MIGALAGLASYVRLVWVTTAVVLLFFQTTGRPLPRVPRWLFFETRPLYLPATAIYWTHHLLFDELARWVIWLAGPMILVDWICWVYYKDHFGDDDRWQRRAAKVSSVVRSLGHRLVVVPAGSS